MSSYRQMRRHARQARRAGMQPMMVINSGDPFPELVIVVIARWAWRYRSELAPLGVALALAGLGWYFHAALRGWWPAVLAGSGAAALVLTRFGARLGIPARLERLYSAVTVLAGGTWVTLAAVTGPLAAPLPQALGIGAAVLAVPWWANRRRRAKVRVERAIAAWPDIARNAGLDGSQVMNATVDLWGWRARLRLARGQTITDVTAKIPAIESGLGTHRGALRVYPTPDDLANRCELRVLDRDPHADAIGWQGPSVTSITQPIDLGPFEDAEPCRVLFLRRHAILGGATGSGKSGGLSELIANLAACRDVVIWAIDLKRGVELKPWAACIDRLATTPAEAAALLADAVTILYARADHLAGHGQREWRPSEAMPALVIIIDEYAELMGQGAVRSQMNIRIAFRVQEQRDVDLILSQGALKAGWHAHKLNAPGKFLVSSPEHDTPRRARAYLLTDSDVTQAAAQYAPARPRLDAVSRAALANKQSRNVDNTDPDQPPDTEDDPEAVLLDALSAAPAQGISVPELIAVTGMSRRWVYYRLRELAAAGRAVQTTRGLWRAA